MRRIGLSSAQPAPSFRVPPGAFRVLCHQFRRDPPVLFVSPSVVRGHSRTRPQPTTPSSSYVKQTILSASARFARLDCVSRSAAERGLRKPHCRAGTRPPPAHGAGPDTLMLQVGGVMSWLTTTSAKQLSDELNELIIAKRYVPPCVISIESKPLPSLIPGPRGTLFRVHIKVGLIKSVL